MFEFKIETKNKVDIGKKPRVYFTCHPDDFDKYFKQVCDDIFKTHDCAVYYSSDMTAEIPEEEKITLERSNLFVIPVTLRLLTTPNRAMDKDYPYAVAHNIPILPIMMEQGLDSIYSGKDRFGERQYLNPFSRDATEILYGDKLKRFLESVLISNEAAERIRAAFDAYIFLSYRKKDRRYANELMRMIHANSECRDIAIWFDEFLTPGESFRENIEKILDGCNLFTLLVTPSILEKVTDGEGNERDNYVVSTELPIARRKKAEKGTEILAVEMEKTDGAGLAAIGVTDCVKCEDSAFRNRLLEAIIKLAVTANDTPEHNFLIGLAYLDGIDVEVDRERAVELITDAAEKGLPEAMEKLYNMYDDGVGVELDYRKAAVWAEKYAEYAISAYGDEHPDTLRAIAELAFIYDKAGSYKESMELSQALYAIRSRILGENHPDTLSALNAVAVSYFRLGDLKKALELQEEVFSLTRERLGDDHLHTLYALNNLAMTCGEAGQYQRALELSERIYALRRESCGEEDPSTLRALDNLAGRYSSMGDYRRALELKEKAYSLFCKTLGEAHPDTLIALDNLAGIYGSVGDYRRALELHLSAYSRMSDTLGETHPDTVTALSNVAMTYGKLGEHKKAEELKKQAYELKRAILGEKHPSTLHALHNLSFTYSEMGEYGKAAELQERVCELRKTVLGENHPDTVTSTYNLGSVYSEMREYDKALKVYGSVYSVSRRVFGEEGELTLKALGDIAAIYYILGAVKEATELQKKVCAARIKTLGEEHPDSINAISNLGYMYNGAGEYERAFELLERAYAACRKTYGETHRLTLEIMTALDRLHNLVFGDEE